MRKFFEEVKEILIFLLGVAIFFILFAIGSAILVPILYVGSIFFVIWIVILIIKGLNDK